MMIEFKLPELGEGVYEAELVEWFVAPGDRVEHGTTLAEVMTDKATMDLPSPFSGQLGELLAESGDVVEVGQAILTYTSIAAADRREEPTVLSQADAPTREDSAGGSRRLPMTQSAHRERPGADPEPNGNGRQTDTPPAAPPVRRLARSLDIPLSAVRGSGPDGRILLDDLSHYIRQGRDPRPPAGKPVRGAFDLGVAGERIKMKALRRSIARNMIESKENVPHFTYIDECDVSALVALKNQLKRPLYKKKVKLTLLPFYVKAITRALQAVPLVNATLDEKNNEIICHDQYHVGVAMATPNGLMVPVIHDADQRGIAGIAKEVERLGRAVRAGSVDRSELRGSTFTLSSVGNFGGLVSTPVIHFPEVGIMAVGKVFKRPVFDDQDRVVPARIAYLSFSFDHRVIDGNVGAIFSNAVIEQLQHPEALL